MKPAYADSLQTAWLWSVGLRYMSGAEEPQHLASLKYELLHDGKLVRVTVETEYGNEQCYVALDEPMTKKQLEDIVRGRTQEALAVSEPRGNA